MAEILTYAIPGTIIATAVIVILLIISNPLFKTDFTPGEHLTFAAIISAVDPVGVLAVMQQTHINLDLFNILFGETTINDGVAIVLFNLFKDLENYMQ